MNAVALLREAAAAGITIRIVEGKARVEGKPEPELLARLRETKAAIVEILTATRCRLCGERLRWTAPVGVTYADGTAECQPCADREVGRIVAAAERVTQSADALGDEAELMLHGELS